MFEHAFVNTSLKSSILFFPERKQRGIDRSYLLHILKNEGYFCFVSRPSDLLGKEGQRKCVLKARLWFCFNFKRARAKARKACSRTNRRVVNFRALWRAHRYIVLWSHLFLLSFPPSFFFYYYYYSIYVFRVFEYSYRIFDGTETLGRSSFIFTRGKIEYFFQFSNFFRNNEFLSKRFGFFSSPRASTCFEAKIKFNIKLFHLSLRPSNLKWLPLKNK